MAYRLSISRSNKIVKETTLETSVIPHLHVILSGQSISEIILNIQVHLQGQQVNFANINVISHSHEYKSYSARAT